MTWLDLLALVGAGAAAGLINTVVGSGTLITFPTLLALGVPPVIANVSNTVGLAPGSLSGAWATRHALTGQRRRVLWLGTASLLGGIAGALLLLSLPSAAFDAIVPALIGLGCVLVILQPFISTRLAIRRARLGADSASVHGPILLWLAVYRFAPDTPNRERVRPLLDACRDCTTRLDGLVDHCRGYSTRLERRDTSDQRYGLD